MGRWVDGDKPVASPGARPRAGRHGLPSDWSRRRWSFSAISGLAVDVARPGKTRVSVTRCVADEEVDSVSEAPPCQAADDGAASRAAARGGARGWRVRHARARGARAGRLRARRSRRRARRPIGRPVALEPVADEAGDARRRPAGRHRDASRAAIRRQAAPRPPRAASASTSWTSSSVSATGGHREPIATSAGWCLGYLNRRRPVRPWAQRLADRRTGRLAGHLTGSIDLVARVAGRDGALPVSLRRGRLQDEHARTRAVATRAGTTTLTGSARRDGRAPLPASGPALLGRVSPLPALARARLQPAASSAAWPTCSCGAWPAPARPVVGGNPLRGVHWRVPPALVTELSDLLDGTSEPT